MVQKASSKSVRIPKSERLVFQPDDNTDSGVRFFLASSLERIFPGSAAGDASRTLTLLVPRNGTVSFQACLKNMRPSPLEIECAVTGGDGLNIRIRRVGYVPLRHLTPYPDFSEVDAGGKAPGLVPDPLFPETKAMVGANESQSFWITVGASRDIVPGMRDLTVRFSSNPGGSLRELKAEIDVRPFVVQPRRDFAVTHWWRAETITDWYKVEPFGKKWCEVTKPYLRDLVSHGTNVIFVPMLNIRREHIDPPPQLLRIRTSAPGKYEFDFSDVKRFVEMAKECGAEYFEWPHLWIYSGVRHPVRIYGHGPDGRSELLIPTDAPATTGTYRLFLEQFLPEFHRFLENEKVLEISYFHISDEPHGEEMLENYKRARALLRELAPWMTVMDALSEVEYGRSGLVDHPIPIIDKAMAYVDEGIPHWVYFCCAPQGPYLNRFYDTPLPKIRMSGWLFYRLKAQGFLHWGYNYWDSIDKQKPIDPFLEGSANSWPFIPYGDPFVVYPGADGPIDSIRWEVFAESLQDYAILQTAGVKSDDPMLAEIRSYCEFPKTAEWIDNTLRRILTEGVQEPAR